MLREVPQLGRQFQRESKGDAHALRKLFTLEARKATPQMATLAEIRFDKAKDAGPSGTLSWLSLSTRKQPRAACATTCRCR